MLRATEGRCAEVLGSDNRNALITLEPEAPVLEKVTA